MFGQNDYFKNIRNSAEFFDEFVVRINTVDELALAEGIKYSYYIGTVNGFYAEFSTDRDGEIAYLKIDLNNNGEFEDGILGKDDSEEFSIKHCHIPRAGLLIRKGQSIFGGKHKGHEYVDLGLSVLWAKTNVGASSKYDSGDYFAWAETKSKNIYSMKTYKYMDYTSKNETKYVLSEGSTVGDDRTILECSDDAATVNWGGTWRMPTEREIEELVTQCKWVWKGNGYEVIGKSNASIFLPAAGYGYDNGYCYKGKFGRYWSSSAYQSLGFRGCCVEFDSNKVECGHWFRDSGFPVRAVCQ